MEDKFLTHENGAPVVDNTNSLTAGKQGPILLEDVWLIEKLAHFDREVIPERRMHAKGSGAFGHFTVTHDVTKYTCAKLFSCIGKQTDVFVRFSTVAGERGAADAERDIRGFAVKDDVESSCNYFEFREIAAKCLKVFVCGSVDFDWIDCFKMNCLSAHYISFLLSEPCFFCSFAHLDTDYRIDLQNPFESCFKIIACNSVHSCFYFYNQYLFNKRRRRTRIKLVDF